MNKATFTKAERLKSRLIMEEIFEKGDTLKKHPFLVKYLYCQFQDQEPLKIVVSIPKRKVKLATKRNRIRRQIKEVYRLNKADLKDELSRSEKSLALFFIYTGKENPDYSLIEEKIKLLLIQLKQKHCSDVIT